MVCTFGQGAEVIIPGIFCCSSVRVPERARMESQALGLSPLNFHSLLHQRRFIKLLEVRELLEGTQGSPWEWTPKERALVGLAVSDP